LYATGISDVSARAAFTPLSALVPVVEVLQHAKQGPSVLLRMPNRKLIGIFLSPPPHLSALVPVVEVLQHAQQRPLVEAAAQVVTVGVRRRGRRPHRCRHARGGDPINVCQIDINVLLCMANRTLTSVSHRLCICHARFARRAVRPSHPGSVHLFK
jgi:hypothetical protein